MFKNLSQIKFECLLISRRWENFNHSLLRSKLVSLYDTYCGIIIVHGESMFVDFFGILFTTILLPHKRRSKVMNRLTLLCNKPLTHIWMNRHYFDILIIHEHSPPRIKMIHSYIRCHFHSINSIFKKAISGANFTLT